MEGTLALMDAMSINDAVVLPYQLQKGNRELNVTRQEAFDALLNIARFPAAGNHAIPEMAYGRMPIEPLLRYADGVGYANLVVDSDGIIRRYPLVRRHAGRLIPSFALVLLARYAEYDLGRMRLTDAGDLLLPGIRFPKQSEPLDLSIPLDAHGDMPINFAGLFLGEAYRHAAYSMFDYLAMKEREKTLPYTREKIGIVADISSGTKDSCTTPLETDFPNPFLYTTVLSSLLSQSYILTLSPWSEALLILLLPLLVTVTGRRFSLRLFMAAAAGSVLLYIAADTAFFADIAGFTAFCDRSEPEVVQDALQEYYTLIVNAVFAQDGVIDKFIGDGVLAFFEHETGNGAVRAVATAVAMQESIQQGRERWRRRYGLDMGIRIGIATGYATVGNLGLPEKLEYTIIGRKVNLASRLEGYGETGQITIDAQTYDNLEGGYDAVLIGPINVKGFSEAVTAYRVVVPNVS